MYIFSFGEAGWEQKQEALGVGGVRKMWLHPTRPEPGPLHHSATPLGPLNRMLMFVVNLKLYIKSQGHDANRIEVNSLDFLALRSQLCGLSNGNLWLANLVIGTFPWPSLGHHLDSLIQVCLSPFSIIKKEANEELPRRVPSARCSDKALGARFQGIIRYHQGFIFPPNGLTGPFSLLSQIASHVFPLHTLDKLPDLLVSQPHIDNAHIKSTYHWLRNGRDENPRSQMTDFIISHSAGCSMSIKVLFVPSASHREDTGGGHNPWKLAFQERIHEFGKTAVSEPAAREFALQL